MRERSLLGKRIVVTRAEEQAEKLTAQLRVLGAEPIICPAITIAAPDNNAPLDTVIAQLDTYDWLIVTSANGVRALATRMAALGVPMAQLRQLKIGAIGPATAQELRKHQLDADFIPSAYVAEAILAEIGDVAGKRILLPRADIAREALAVGLREKGATVDEIAAYRTIPGPGALQLAARLRTHSIDAITFTSSSTVRYLLDGLQANGMPRGEARGLFADVAVVCIGPITEATAREEGLRVDAVADEYTADGLVKALVGWARGDVLVGTGRNA
jgi:uroporphyrinogen-III synthase